MIIYRDGEGAYNVTPLDESTQVQKIMGEDVVNMQLELARPIPLLIGDYLLFDNKRYTLYDAPTVREVNSRKFRYTFVFKGEVYKLLRSQYMLFDTPTETQVPPVGDFSLMGNARTFLELMVKNLNRNQSGWSVGEVIETDVRNLSFSGEDCLAVLQRLATEYDTEYWLSEPQIINFSKKEDNSSYITMAYGQGNGLKEITRSNRDQQGIVTRLYAYGSERNIKTGYRDGAKRLMLPGGQYIENNTDKYGVIESVQVFDEVYPRLRADGSENAPGKITAIDGIYRFTDTNLDFNVNTQLMPGVTAKVVFTSGQLNGYEFEIQSFDNTNKTYTIIRAEYENALELPNALLHAEVGDEYVLVDINMPGQYIDRAEQELLEKASEFLTKNSEVRDAFSCVCDTLHMKNYDILFWLGQMVGIWAPELNADRQIRIVGITRELNMPYRQTLELSDTVSPSRIDKIQTTGENNERIINMSKLRDPNYVRRNWRDVQELLNMVFDPDGYFTDKIRPLSIETSMLVVGARSQQFDFVGMVMKPNYDGDPNAFANSAGTLVHFTISENSTPEWNIAGNLAEGLNPSTAYYVYAQCNRANNYGEIVVSETAYKVDADPNVWYFLVGVLNSVYEGVRNFKPTYGFTEITGEYITTGIIQSRDGRTNFNLNDSIIDLNARAGITGKGDAVRAWFGGSYQDALDNLASIIFNDDGSGQLAKGNVNWDENGNVNIKGHIEALSGTFKGSVESRGLGKIVKLENGSIELENTDGQNVASFSPSYGSGASLIFREWLSNGDLKNTVVSANGVEIFYNGVKLIDISNPGIWVNVDNFPTQNTSNLAPGSFYVDTSAGNVIKMKR